MKCSFNFGSDISFVGFSNSATWNGFDCPFFEKEECDKIANHINKEDMGIQIIYNEDMDAYVEVDNNLEEQDYQIYKSTTIATSEGPKVVYPLGAYNWTWWKD